ncbi:MAG: PilZ domain-containing protein [Deltaproteobacteria bacterium]|nr:PilZ domain-containing protein [Deltaproteobacteria bacterium]
MTRLAGWIRASLWSSTHWPSALETLTAQIASDASRAFDLAQAFELIEPDRKRALAMHRLAWRLGGNVDALTRANAIARDLGAHDVVAELAAEHGPAGDPAPLVTAALAWLDAGSPQHAESHLVRAAELDPRDEIVKSALAMIRRESRDPQRDIATWVARAARVGSKDSSAYLLHAARLARLAGFETIYARHLTAAWLANADESTAKLIEQRLIEERNADALLAFYRGRLESASDDARWVETMRSAGTTLMMHNVQRGLANRLLRSCLEVAYRAGMIDVPGHLATWHLLVEHAREMRSTDQLLPLISEAILLPYSDEERFYVGRMGLEIDQAGRDPQTARRCAAVVAELNRNDPTGHGFAVRDRGEPGADAPEVSVLFKPRGLVGPPPVSASAVPTGPTPTGPTPTGPSPTVKNEFPPGAEASVRSSSSENAHEHGVQRARRIVVPVDVELHVPGGASFAAVVRDLSVSGVFVVVDRDLEIGTSVTLELHIPGSEPLSQSIYHSAARIARRAGNGYGVVFVAPDAKLLRAIAALGERCDPVRGAPGANPVSSERVDRVFAQSQMPLEDSSRAPAAAPAPRTLVNVTESELALRRQISMLQRKLADAQRDLANKDEELATEVEKRTALAAAAKAIGTQVERQTAATKAAQARNDELTAELDELRAAYERATSSSPR